MKISFKFLILLLLFFQAIGDAHSGNCIPYGTTVTLSRQSQVDSFPINFPGCDVVEGFLVISGSDIANLDSMIGLRKIYNLGITNNPILLNLNGLDSINMINSLELSNNDILVNFNGLNNLDSSNSLMVYNNPNLINFDGLDKVRNLDDFYVSNNDALNSFIGLKQLKSVTNNFYVSYNDSIINFIGLDSLAKIGGTFHVVNNVNFQDFKGINLLSEVFTLHIVDNPVLINFDGLQSLIKLDNFNISSNALLQDFTGLDNITTTNQHCGIYYNPSLVSFYGLNNWHTITTGFISIVGNDALINLTGLNSLKSVGGIQISNNIKLKNLKGLEQLTDFSTLVTGTYIVILDNPSLCNINDLNNEMRLQNTLINIQRNPNLNCCRVIDTILRNNTSYTHVFINDNAPGCNDTTEIRTITTQNCCTTKYSIIRDTICSGEQIVFNNQILTNTGTYYDTLLSNGMDSIIILELKVYNKSYSIQYKSLCIGQSFTLSNGIVITTDGIYKDSIPNFCDSIIEYRLSFLNNITVNQNPVICKGKTYTLPKGNIVSLSGTYRDTLQASFGCDSIVVTNLTITNPIPFTDNVTICSGKTLTRPNGNFVSATGIYYDTIKAPNTCDSIVITNLTVTPYLQSSQSTVVCLGKSFVLPGGRSVSQNGIYKDTVRNNLGCDSIITTNLTITNPVPFNSFVSICEGQTFTLPGGRSVVAAGTYTDTIRQATSCDSIVITNLSVFPNAFTVSLNSTDTIESGNAIALLSVYANGTAVSWNWTPAANLSCTACENPVASPAQTSVYLVKVRSEDGCEDTAQTTIIVRQTTVYIPEAFSPNNDNINDQLEVFAVNPKSYSLKIYNRWGELVFESKEISNRWNGTFNGENCPQDNYSYIVDVTMQNDKTVHKQGSIMLLR